MEHRFSKHEYIISCSLTFFFVGLLSASYFDIATCPSHTDRVSPSHYPRFFGDGNAAADGVHDTASPSSSPELTKSLLTVLRRNNGLTCHMIDMAVWIYILGLVVFLSHKYITYRMQGLHYFFLDYCYFHSTVLVVFLMWRLVDVRWSARPIVSWAAYLPAGWTTPPASATMSVDGSRGIGSAALQTSEGFDKGGLVRAAKKSAGVYRVPDGLYYPLSVDVLTTSYVFSHLTTNEVVLAVVLFFTLLAGSFGPILGAILMWHNALLFHSFDRMSSCYLHLLPGTIQGMLLHRLFTAARHEIMSAPPAELLKRAASVAAQFHESLYDFLPPHVVDAVHAMPTARNGKTLSEAERFALYAERHPLEAFCGRGTLCHHLSRHVTYGNLLWLHFLMFCVWQVFYHVFYEVRRRQRAHNARKKQLKEMAKRRAEMIRLTGLTEEEADLLRPAVSLSEGLTGDPAQRVTAYTWMMDHPPGGRHGLPFRFCTCLGTGRLPTTVLFQVCQWITHTIFFTLCYPVLYIAVHVQFAAWPLLLYCCVFALLTVANAASMNKKWIGNLQKMAAVGMEAERVRQSMAPGDADAVAAAAKATASEAPAASGESDLGASTKTKKKQ